MGIVKKNRMVAENATLVVTECVTYILNLHNCVGYCIKRHTKIITIINENHKIKTKIIFELFNCDNSETEKFSADNSDNGRTLYPYIILSAI